MIEKEELEKFLDENGNYVHYIKSFNDIYEYTDKYYNSNFITIIIPKGSSVGLVTTSQVADHYISYTSYYEIFSLTDFIKILIPKSEWGEYENNFN